jgi:hypothetical protein
LACEGAAAGLSDTAALRKACAELGPADQRHVEVIFHDNAAQLIAGILERKRTK